MPTNRSSSVRTLSSRLVALVFACLAGAPSVIAQTVATERLRLNAGPCTIDSVNGTPDQLRLVDCSTLTTSSATNLTLAPTGDLVLGPSGVDVLPNTGYTVNLGALSNKYLTLHAAELWVETLVAQNTMATLGGRVLVAPTNILTADIGTGATSISVKYNNLANGDRVYLEANGAVEFMAVTSSASGSGPYTYSVTRNLDGSGANAWTAGDAVLNTGTTGNGFIDLYSTAGVLSGSGPTIVGNVRTGTTYNNIAPRWAIGNLNGLYGYGATTYGAAFGDASATNVTVDATNGFRIRSGTTNKLTADTSGNLSIVGDLSVGTSGVIRSGATSYASGTGWIMEYNGGTPRFRIGTAAGNRLTWDGTTLAVYGDGSGLTSIDGSQIQTGTINAGAINATGFGDNVIKNGTFEGATSAAQLSGWKKGNDSTGSADISTTNTGTAGPGALYIAPGNGFYMQALYKAFPVDTSSVYRVSFDLYSTGSGGGPAFNAVLFESSSSASTVSYVQLSGASGTDVNFTSSKALYADAAVASGWTHYEVTYTPTAGAKWASLSLMDKSGTVGGSTYTILAFDNVEVQKQLGPGHIRAASITADRMSVTSLSAISAALGTVTSGAISIAGGVFNVASNGATYISVLDAGTIQTTNASIYGIAGGGNQYVCVAPSGTLYGSAGGC